MAHVTINDTIPQASFSVGGTPSTGPFNLGADFAVFDPSTDLVVYVGSTLATYSATPSTSSQYSFSGTLIDGGYQGGSITLGAAVSNTTVTVQRDIPIKRTTDFPYPSATFDIKEVNSQIDRLFAHMQDAELRDLRHLRQPESDSSNIGALPAKAVRANAALAFDANGDPIASGGVSAVAVSAAMTPVVQAATLAAGRTAFGLGDAATKTIGTAAGNVVALDGSARLPAVDGSQLTGLGVADSGGFALQNGKIVASVAANALTVAVKTLAGADPSAGSPVKVTVPDGAGGYNTRSITGALSVVISSGSTMGFSNSVPGRLWLALIDNGGVLELAAVNCKLTDGILSIDETGTISTTAEGGAGAADAAGTFYSATARASLRFRLIGFVTWNSGLATAGTWNAAPDITAQLRIGDRVPGFAFPARSKSWTDTWSQTPVAGTFYQPTNASGTLTVNSPANCVRGSGFLSVTGWGAQPGGMRVKRGSTVIAAGAAAGSRQPIHAGGPGGGGDVGNGIPIRFWDATPGSGSVTYNLEVFEGSTNALHQNRMTTDTDSANYPRMQSVLELQEIVA